MIMQSQTIPDVQQLSQIVYQTVDATPVENLNLAVEPPIKSRQEEISPNADGIHSSANDYVIIQEVNYEFVYTKLASKS